jgi:cell division protein FtsX
VHLPPPDLLHRAAACLREIETAGVLMMTVGVSGFLLTVAARIALAIASRARIISGSAP